MMWGAVRLGLTGGIGSGKSTVAGILAKHGAAVIDADALSRQATAAGGPAIAPIAKIFGPEFIGADGALDRARMRALAFQDPGARRRLEQIIHPLVGLQTQLQTQAALDAGKRCLVFDIPLLVESSHWRSRLDRILVLDCSPQTQIERVMQRSGLSQPEVEGIMAQQASRSSRLRAADLVICNDGLNLTELAQLAGQVAARFGL